MLLLLAKLFELRQRELRAEWCVLVYFKSGTPNNRKTPYPENPKSQEFWTKYLTIVLF
jgi:hypothetical protein